LYRNVYVQKRTIKTYKILLHQKVYCFCTEMFMYKNVVHTWAREMYKNTIWKIQ